MTNTDLFMLLVAILACYRLARLLAIDDGPWDILLFIRGRLGAYDYDETGSPETSLGKWAGCPHCQGIYIAAVFALLIYPFDWRLIFWWLAIAGGQSFLQSLAER